MLFLEPYDFSHMRFRFSKTNEERLNNNGNSMAVDV